MATEDYIDTAILLLNATPDPEDGNNSDWLLTAIEMLPAGRLATPDTVDATPLILGAITALSQTIRYAAARLDIEPAELVREVVQSFHPPTVE